MFIRSLWNPNAFTYTINWLLKTYTYLICMILTIVILLFIVKYIFKLIRKIKENKKNKEKLLKKQDMKEIFSKEKWIFRVLKYPLIWSVLVRTCWLQVSIVTRLFNAYYETETNIIRENLPAQEERVLSKWPTYSVLIFILAWCFIWLSFWNKMLRNIWILIYALWILFILFVVFLNNGVIINNLPNFTI